MTPDNLTESLAVIGWGQRELARRCGVTSQFINALTHGRSLIPAWIAVYVMAMRAAVESVKPPSRPRWVSD